MKYYFYEALHVLKILLIIHLCDLQLLVLKGMSGKYHILVFVFNNSIKPQTDDFPDIQNCTIKVLHILVQNQY